MYLCLSISSIRSDNIEKVTRPSNCLHHVVGYTPRELDIGNGKPLPSESRVYGRVEYLPPPKPGSNIYIYIYMIKYSK